MLHLYNLAVKYIHPLENKQCTMNSEELKVQVLSKVYSMSLNESLKTIQEDIKGWERRIQTKVQTGKITTKKHIINCYLWLISHNLRCTQWFMVKSIVFKTSAQQMHQQLNGGSNDDLESLKVHMIQWMYVSHVILVLFYFFCKEISG